MAHLGKLIGVKSDNVAAVAIVKLEIVCEKKLWWLLLLSGL
jgi:hypothetical protein